nr:MULTISPECIES: PAS domain-containing sensor histidine kinase [Myxococcaceae]
MQRSVLGPLQPLAFPGAAPLLQAAQEALRRGATRQDPVERELPLEVRGGAGWLRVRAVVLPSAAPPGAPADAPQVALFLEDTSLARAFEQELRRSRELMYAVVEATSDAIYVKDPQGHYLFINAAGAQALGRGVSGVVGHTDAELFPPTLAEATRAHDLEVLERRQTLSYEHAEEPERGTGRVWQSTKGVLLHPDGRVRALFGTSRDVTERRRAERLHERLLGILGHDLRSPLTALALDLLQLRRLAPPGPLQHLGERLGRTARRVERLVALLLDYTQLHAGRPLLLNRQEVELRGLLEVALREALAGHPPRAVELVGEPLRARLDRPRMALVFAQLLDNALRHSPPASPLTVTLRCEGGRARVQVHNEGAPIPLERLQHLFEAPEMAPSAAAEETVRLSLGLGLHVARATVEAHGGHLEVSSGEGVGTVVTVTLPLGDGQG